jgi:hypothetical protein
VKQIQGLKILEMVKVTCEADPGLKILETVKVTCEADPGAQNFRNGKSHL